MNFKSRNGRFWLPLLWVLTAALLMMADYVPKAIASHDSSIETYYIVAHPTFALGLPAMFVLFALVYLGIGFAPSFRMSTRLAYAHLGCLAIGAILVKLPSIALTELAMPARYQDPARVLALWSRIAAVGYGLILASLALFAYVLVKAFLDGSVRSKPGG